MNDETPPGDNDDDDLTGFAVGQLWKLRTPTDGSGFRGVKIFETPEELWVAACTYFQWIEDNPLKETKVFCSQGVIRKTEVNRMRAMSLRGLQLHLGIAKDTWYKWHQQRPDLAEVLDAISSVIYTQKFEGAAVDLLNANLVIRDLGLRDVKEMTGPNGGPVQTITSEMSPKEAAAAYAATLQDDEG